MEKDLNPFSGRKVKMIELVFENFESFKIDVSGVSDFNIFDIKYSISFFVKLENDGDINPGTYCDVFFISLNEKGREVHGEIDDKITLKEFVKEHYVTNANLIFDDNSHLYVSLPWIDGDDESCNTLQEVGGDNDYTYIKINALEE